MGWWTKFKASVVAWLDFQPRAPYYTLSQLEDIRLREEALGRTAKRVTDSLYEESRADRLKDDERLWPKELEAGWPETGGVNQLDEWYKEREKEGVYFGGYPYMGFKFKDVIHDLEPAPPPKRSRKLSKAKAPKKAHTPTPKARKATKARTTRKKAIPISIGKRGSR